MKFGETFTEYLHGDQEWFLDKCSRVEYKRLKKVLKSCRTCQGLDNSCKTEQELDDNNISTSSALCQSQSCPLCDQIFFSELMKEALEIAGCFTSRVRHLLHLHVAGGMHRCFLLLGHCFKGDYQAMLKEGQILMDYATMNAIAIQKILKKYDKVHCSVNRKNFKSKMRAEHIELLQSPWLIELGAFCLNFNGLDAGKFSESCGQCSCDINDTEAVMTLMLPNSTKIEYSLTCAICLEAVFNPYALSCGHLFCKVCACSAASTPIFEGLRAASRNVNCPICRETGVYANAVLDLLLKRRCREYWKERMVAERAAMMRQTKDYWDFQTKCVIGY